MELERRLTQDPEIERQMADGDVGPPPEGGREAWAVVAGAFFVLFCVFGFGESFTASLGSCLPLVGEKVACRHRTQNGGS